MRSKLAKLSRDELEAISKSMSSDERLQAFVEHSRAVAELYRQGKRVPSRAPSRKPRRVPPKRTKIR